MRLLNQYIESSNSSPDQQKKPNKELFLIVIFGLFIFLTTLLGFSFIKKPADVTKLIKQQLSKPFPEQVAQPKPEEERSLMRGVEIATESAEVKRRAEDISKLTSQLLQTLKESSLIVQPVQATSSSQVKGTQTSVNQEQALSQAKDIAGKRKNEMLKLMQQSPRAFLSQTIPTNVRETLPEDVKNQVEGDKEVQGRLTVVHTDSKDKKKTKLIYSVDDPNSPSPTEKRQTLHFAKAPKNLSSGAVIKAKGVGFTSNLALASATSGNVQVLSSVTNVSATTNKKVGVIKIKFGNETLNPAYSNDLISTMLFTDTRSVDNYYKENSYNKVSFVGGADDVFGWFNIDYDKNLYCDDYEAEWNILDKAWDVAASNGVNMGYYENLIFLFPPQDQCEIYSTRAGILGSATLGNHGNIGLVWINGLNESSALVGSARGVPILAHELGHNLGLLHAGTLDCGSKAMDVEYIYNPNCVYDDYGDIYDTMGFSNLRQFNGPHKLEAGWLPTNKVQTLAEQGTYEINLAPIEVNNPTNPQLVKIKKADTYPDWNDYYFVSYRQPVGFDSGLPAGITRGASIHVGNEGARSNVLSISTMQVDASPNGIIDNILGGSFDDAALNETDNSTFTDQTNGITVRQTAHDANGVRLTITIGQPQCVRKAPTLSITPRTQSGSAGQNLTYLVNVTNNDTSSCQPSNFSFSTEVTQNSGWGEGFSPAQISNLAPGASNSVTWTITSPSYQGYSAWGFWFDLNDNASWEHYATETVSYIVFAPSANISSVTPTSGSVGTDITILGSGFGAAQGQIGFSSGSASYPSEYTIALRATEISVWEDTRIVVKVPAGALNGKILIKTTDSRWIQSNSNFEIINTPVIEQIFPTSGYEGDSITVTGRGFGPRERGSVTLGDKLITGSNLLSWSDAIVTARVPVGSGTGRITVKGTNSKIARSSVTYIVSIQVPNITEITPTSGPINQEVTISGSNFGPQTGGEVRFGTYSTDPDPLAEIASISSWSNGVIVARVPTTSLNKGKFNIKTARGLSATSTQEFTVTRTDNVTVDSVVPNSGTVDTSITLTGRGFGNTQGNGKVEFGKRLMTTNGEGFSFQVISNQTITSWSDTTIVFKVAGNNPDTGVLRVTTGSGGQAYSPTFQILASSFQSPSPTPTNCPSGYYWNGSSCVSESPTPTSGPSSPAPTTPTPGSPQPVPPTPGFKVKIQGAVAINGSNALGTNRFTAAPSCPGKDFRIDTNVKVNSSQLNQDAKWDCEPGYYFGNSKGSEVDSTPGSHNFVFTPPSGYKCTWYAVYGGRDSETFTPGSTNCIVSVNLSAGKNDPFIWFFVEQEAAPSAAPVPDPTISGFTPSNGAVGTTVTINGDNFGSSKGTVTFNGATATVADNDWTNTSIRATVPNTTSGKVRVQTSSGKIVDSSSNFTVELPKLQYKIKGAVAVDGSNDLGPNRFTNATCPGEPFITSSSLHVNNPELGNASWDCQPGYYYGTAWDTFVNISPGTQTFTITPPPGWTCAWYAVYGDRDTENFNGCTVTTYLSKNQGDMFIWFKLRASVQGAAYKPGDNTPPKILSTALTNGKWLSTYKATINIVDSDREKITAKIEGLPLFVSSSCQQSQANLTCEITGRPLWKGLFNVKITSTDSVGASDSVVIPLFIR